MFWDEPRATIWPFTYVFAFHPLEVVGTTSTLLVFFWTVSTPFLKHMQSQCSSRLSIRHAVTAQKWGWCPLCSRYIILGIWKLKKKSKLAFFIHNKIVLLYYESNIIQISFFSCYRVTKLRFRLYTCKDTSYDRIWLPKRQLKQLSCKIDSM